MIPGVTVRVGGAFAEYTRPLGNDIVLSVGARIDSARSQADPALANTTLYEAYQGTRSLSATETLPAGKLRLAWRRGDWELAAGVGHAPRVPEATERYLALRRMGTDWVGNPELAASRNTGLDVAASLTHAGVRVDLGLYTSRVSDYVTVYDQARRLALPGVMNAQARSFANVDATLTGGELGFSLPIVLGRVFVSGDVSYVRGQQDGEPSRHPGGTRPESRRCGRLMLRRQAVLRLARGVFAADQERVDASLGGRTPGGACWAPQPVSGGPGA
jgi:iron complex outermembrane receptor protein